MDQLKIEVAEALVLKPGDRVLLLTKDNFHWTRQVADEVRAVLEERFPDVQFAFAVGVEGAIVEPAEKENP